MPLIEMWMPRCSRSSTVARAVAAHQFDLQVVQRVDVGEAVADRALQCRVARQPLLRAGDQRRARRDGAVPFGLDHARRSSGAACGRPPARRSARPAPGRSWPAPCPCSTAACERTATARTSAAAAPCAPCARPALPPACRNCSIAEPKPYQPGSVRRHWPQLKPQGTARRSSMLRLGLREAGREPMLSSAISRIGVALKK